MHVVVHLTWGDHFAEHGVTWLGILYQVARGAYEGMGAMDEMIVLMTALR
jgi:hypothetical protein